MTEPTLFDDLEKYASTPAREQLADVKNVEGTHGKARKKRVPRSSLETGEVGEVVTLSVGNITVDRAVQVRETIDEAIVQGYADAMKEGAKFPPVVVFDQEDADKRNVLA